VHCAKRIEVSLHVRGALHASSDVRLATYPGNEAFRQCSLIRKQGSAIGP
jgi:hypothetical protein